MKTVFIALGFHLKNTKSSQFFIDILEDNISDLTVVSEREAWYEIPRIKPDTIILWQHIFSPKEIDSWGAKNIIIIPMYDACPHTEEFWNKYKKYKIFCFSKTLYLFLDNLGFKVLHSQYYTNEPQDSLINNNNVSVFFWERSKKIHWKTVKNILGNSKINSFHYHYSTNINETNDSKPTSEDIENFNITFSDWFKTKEEYKEILSKATIYIAPRESEGIGLSFIEALCQGSCVIAYNAPTMNEYIEHGVNGYLFDENISSSLDFSPKTIKQLRLNALKKAQSGYTQWIKSIPDIILFIQEPLLNYTPKINIRTYIYKRLRSEIRHIVKRNK